MFSWFDVKILSLSSLGQKQHMVLDCTLCCPFHASRSTAIFHKRFMWQLWTLMWCVLSVTTMWKSQTGAAKWSTPSPGVRCCVWMNNGPRWRKPAFCLDEAVECSTQTADIVIITACDEPRAHRVVGGIGKFSLWFRLSTLNAPPVGVSASRGQCFTGSHIRDQRWFTAEEKLCHLHSMLQTKTSLWEAKNPPPPAPNN